VKPKLIARRSPEDAQFLENLASYVARSGATGRDEVFSFRKEDGTEVPLRGRTVREELKSSHPHTSALTRYGRERSPICERQARRRKIGEIGATTRLDRRL
jgi:hypothetical protein